MKIGVLGGTFNPIHYGHLRTAEEVLEILTLDSILFIPSGTPPFRKPELASARDRYEMTRLAIKDNPNFELSDIEIKSRGISYSVETFSKLLKKYKNTEFFFVLGIDAFMDIQKWKQPNKLMTLTNLVIISRPGFSFSDLFSSPYIAEEHKPVLRDIDKGAKTEHSLFLKTGKKVFFCKVSGLEISASCIRTFVRTGKNIKYLLPDSVESYIISNKLYRK